MIIPTHLAVETINGACTARCTMCPVHSLKRSPNVMDMSTFEIIMEKFLPYRDNLQYLSLFGMGEPLLDPGLPSKIEVARGMGFKGIGIASNCTELTVQKSHELLRAGLDTLICSVDGFTRETHEAIRIGTDWEQVTDNIHTFLWLRGLYPQRTKVLIRFVRQQSNQHEWDQFYDYWRAFTIPKRGDQVLSYDIVDYNGKVAEYDVKDTLVKIEVPKVCTAISSRMMVCSKGEVPLCPADCANAEYGGGNVLDEEPMAIFNNKVSTHYREMILAGRIMELELCKTCTIPRSEMTKDRVEGI